MANLIRRNLNLAPFCTPDISRNSVAQTEQAQATPLLLHTERHKPTNGFKLGWTLLPLLVHLPAGHDNWPNQKESVQDQHKHKVSQQVCAHIVVTSNSTTVQKLLKASGNVSTIVGLTVHCRIATVVVSIPENAHLRVLPNIASSLETCCPNTTNPTKWFWLAIPYTSTKMLLYLCQYPVACEGQLS